MDNLVNIAGIPKHIVLKALHDNSKIQGRVNMNFIYSTLTEKAAKEYINQNNDLYFDYVNGRVIKTDISKDSIDPWLYDRDNGKGACARAIGGIK